jgi:dolichol-phosphate mannosyltransferase
MKTISVIIPVYNEGENVDAICSQVMDVHARVLGRYALEIVFTDNASSDDTFARIERLAGANPHVKGIQLSRNFGYQASILTGYLNASGDAVVQMDSDGEDPPEMIPEFVALWEQGFQVVYGVRISRQESAPMQWQRMLFYRILKRISSVDLPRGAGDFRLLDRVVVDTLVSRFNERNPYLRGLVSFIGFRQTGVPYHRGRREKGPSKFGYFDYMRLAWDAITSFSRVPLKFVSYLGCGMSVVAGLGAVFYLVLFAAGRVPIQGFTTIILALLLLSGIQLLSLGILGEYLSRIFDEVKARPRSIVARSTGFSEPPRSA